MKFNLDKAFRRLAASFSGQHSDVPRLRKDIKALLVPVVRSLENNDISVHNSKAVVLEGSDDAYGPKIEAFRKIEFLLEVSLASDWYEAPRKSDVEEEIFLTLNEKYIEAKRVKALRDSTVVWGVVLDLSHCAEYFKVPNPFFDEFDRGF